ncbi:N-acetylgalactosamine-6-sulfatase [Alteromonas sp. KC3]|uniref:sulfatase-like hydrolase/transferase n=1 Tax=unclassified Alteromonas TaxID=2614992 RepID=UPI0019241D07|nr:MULTISPECIES: sulfatase-like hydrolase/transferase [unclassified Alteromonas]BCO19672.1 N-acetylgalactosamine-6-sulfatase [Alteromonas sp. KC3]BCO23637.1 N-acetylgalactosamine-6-sulfatase [Alteromonas sp. KC14]
MKKQVTKLLAALSFLSALPAVAIEAERPNILVIITDDQGYADVGYHGFDNDVKTPSLDTLANEGVRFSSGYVAHPFCGPSRTALMTGRYPHKIGADFNLPVDGSSTGIDTNEIFISKALQQVGYHTGAIGKWHLGEEAPYQPNSRGFDEFYGFLGGGHKFFPDQYRAQYEKAKASGVKRFNDYITPLMRNTKEVRETEYLTDAFTREAVDFIDRSGQNKQQPFFLYLAYNAPHVPLEAKEEDLALFSHIKDKKRRTYLAMVYAVDRGIAEIVETLKKTKQYDNTLIVFVSDNGGKRKWGGVNLPLQEGKGSAREGGHRVPMFFHWPKGLKGGKQYDAPVSTLDYYPTFLALAQSEAPRSKKLDGKNILPHIIDNTSAREGESLFIMRHRKGAHDVSVRRDDFKAVRTTSTGGWKLFDVAKDIGETNDLSAQYPQLLADMVKDAGHWAWSNKPPQWFHIHKEGDEWRSEDMPRYGETFELD